jgi:vancomycin resistance protein YoaR
MTDELLTSPGPDIAATSAESFMDSIATPRRSIRARFALAFLVGLVAALAVGAGALYAFDRHYTDKILPGVSIGGLDVSGLTEPEARAAIAQRFGSFGRGQALLTSGDVEMAIDYADIDRRPDIDAMIAEAMAVGRSGNLVERVVLDARTAVRGVALQPRVAIDGSRLARYVQTHAGRLTVDPKDAVVIPTKGGFGVVEGVPGRAADRRPATEFLTATLARTDAPDEVRVELELAPIEPDITTGEATAALKTAERIALDVVIKEGKEAWTIPAATVRSWIDFKATSDGGYEPVVDNAGVDAALAAVAKKVEQKAKSASFKTSGSKITGVIASRNGRSLDKGATASRVTELLATRASGGANAPVKPALTVKVPSLTTEEAKAAAPKMRKISTWTTYFPISERNHFGANIWIPALDIDGTVVAPHEKFDFWSAVGPISRARGYGDGGAIINGKTEPQGALAGGICSNSTTLFNAVLRAGFEMGARRNHYYFIDRYPTGLDATVFKSGSGSVQTMSWTNDTDYPVLIRGYKIRDGSRGYVRYDIYSVPNGRKVVIGNPTIRNIRRAWDTVRSTSSLPTGARKRIETPVDGKDVWRTVTVYQGGKVIHQTTYYSHYSRIIGVVLVGK